MNINVSTHTISQTNKTFLARTHKLFIGGEWVAPATGKSFAVFNPANGLEIARVAEGGPEDIDRAVAAARKAFESGPWPKMKPAERAALMLRLADLIEDNANELAELETLDNGKPIRNARTVDVAQSYETLRYMAGWATKITGKYVPLSTPGHWHAYTTREPIGVVGQIIPWNYPLMMASWKIAPALAAGCTIVLKPAEQTPLTALRLGELIQEAGFPDGVVNIVTGDGSAGAAITNHPDVDKVAFTGSTEVGKLIVKAAAGNLKKVSLELGGKSPVIVLPDADLSVTIPGTASGIFYNMGQNCTAGSRMFVHKTLFDKVMTGLSDEAGKLTMGSGLDPSNDMGPVVSDEQMNRINGYIDAGKKDGAELVTGGNRYGGEGYFVEPTILANTSGNMSVVREEIFGPVLCAMPYDDDDFDAIALLANDTEYGLAASIWTQNVSSAHRLASKIRAGSVWVNTHNFVEAGLPFGGFKQSGWGRELGSDVLDLYTESKSVVVKL